ncbi:hypothetical protein M7752_13325 [Streptomyces sp. BSP1]|nr:hypothetical protein [Streptomyces sp. BSP1]
MGQSEHARAGARQPSHPPHGAVRVQGRRRPFDGDGVARPAPRRPGPRRAGGGPGPGVAWGRPPADG